MRKNGNIWAFEPTYFELVDKKDFAGRFFEGHKFFFHAIFVVLILDYLLSMMTLIFNNELLLWYRSLGKFKYQLVIDIYLLGIIMYQLRIPLFIN